MKLIFIGNFVGITSRLLLVTRTLTFERANKRKLSTRNIYPPGESKFLINSFSFCATHCFSWGVFVCLSNPIPIFHYKICVILFYAMQGWNLCFFVLTFLYQTDIYSQLQVTNLFKYQKRELINRAIDKLLYCIWILSFGMLFWCCSAKRI